MDKIKGRQGIMAKKFIELETKERQTERARVTNNIEGRNATTERENEGWQSMKDKWGHCASCHRFQFANSESEILHAYCGSFDRPLSGRNPIINCSNYRNRFQMSIEAMFEIAYIIEAPKDIIGFKGDEE